MDATNTYPSEFITGNVSQRANQFCLREKSLDLFFRDMRQQIESDLRGDVDGEKYIGYLGTWKITVRHNYKVSEERGGDHHHGIWETIPVVEVDEMEVLSAYDEQYMQNLPGLRWKLNAFNKAKRY